jgi:hypothetical protein
MRKGENIPERKDLGSLSRRSTGLKGSKMS